MFFGIYKGERDQSRADQLVPSSGNTRNFIEVERLLEVTERTAHMVMRKERYDRGGGGLSDPRSNIT